MTAAVSSQSHPRRQTSLVVLYTCTVFISAVLLFLVQPMVGLMLLPKFGGTPAVWATCMVFFQAALLAGYAYAHAATQHLRLRQQIVAQVLLLGAAVLALPLLRLSVAWDPPGDAAPTLWVLTLLAGAIGLPFFVISTSAPLLQKWFSESGHSSARDPYFLYAASNSGSMAALLAYPLIVQRLLGIEAQNYVWMAGYVALLIATAWAGYLVWSAPAGNGTAQSPEDVAAAAAEHPAVAHERTEPDIAALGDSPPTPLQRLRWIALAFVPSSLFIAVTTYITTDIASLPLLWVIPLAIYLLTFIIVFGRVHPFVHQAMVALMPVLVLLLVLVLVTETQFTRIEWQFLLHLATLFVVSMVCHGELARARPAPGHLTGFYLCMSLGGTLGGVFNALVAPFVFRSVQEYSLAIVVACLLMPQRDGARKAGTPQGQRLSRWLDLALPVALGVLAVFLISSPLFPQSAPESLRRLVAYGLPIAICFGFADRSVRFGLGVAAVFLAGALGANTSSTIFRDRSFFGVLKVDKRYALSNDGTVFHEMLHGTTLHGVQRQDNLPLLLLPLTASEPLTAAALTSCGRRASDELRLEPLTYYHRNGPIGQIYVAFCQPDKPVKVAFIGLGTGSLASYLEPGQHGDFYEIDKMVVDVASDPRLFTYLRDCRGTYNVQLGDARLKLKEAAPHSYQLIVIDAFSSDAIPVHLITREAVELYFAKLADNGVLALHITNRHLELSPVLGNIARTLGLAGLVESDGDDLPPGKSKSDWVILARHRATLRPLLERRQAARWTMQANLILGMSAAPLMLPVPDPLYALWDDLDDDPEQRTWTDDFSNIVGVLRLWEKERKEKGWGR